jgi:hypothetical protein
MMKAVGIILGALVLAVLLGWGCGTIRDLYQPDDLCVCGHSLKHHSGGHCDECDCDSFYSY